MPETTLTIAQKIEAIEKSEMSLAFDGCHKIYFLQDDERERDAREIGYDIYPCSKLRELLEASCSLVFVNRWGMGSTIEEANADFAHDLNIEQFDEDLWRFMGWPLGGEDDES